MIRREGVRALWRGNGVTIVHRLPYSAVNFWAYERFTEMWLHRFPASPAPGSAMRGGARRSDMIRRLAAGGAAGLCACTLVSSPGFLDAGGRCQGVTPVRSPIRSPAAPKPMRCCARCLVLSHRPGRWLPTSSLHALMQMLL